MCLIGATQTCILKMGLYRDDIENYSLGGISVQYGDCCIYAYGISVYILHIDRVLCFEHIAWRGS